MKAGRSSPGLPDITTVASRRQVRSIVHRSDESSPANWSVRVLKRAENPAVSDQRILEVLRGLRTPRHLFKFLYRLLVTHCNSHVEGEPVWRVPAATFESTLALYRRDQDAFDRGVGAG